MSTSLKDKENKQEQNIFKYIISALRLSIDQLKLHEKTQIAPFTNRLDKLEEILDELGKISESF